MHQLSCLNLEKHHHWKEIKVKATIRWWVEPTSGFSPYRWVTFVLWNMHAFDELEIVSLHGLCLMYVIASDPSIVEYSLNSILSQLFHFLVTASYSSLWLIYLTAAYYLCPFRNRLLMSSLCYSNYLLYGSWWFPGNCKRGSRQKYAYWCTTSLSSWAGTSCILDSFLCSISYSSTFTWFMSQFLDMLSKFKMYNLATCFQFLNNFPWGL